MLDIFVLEYIKLSYCKFLFLFWSDITVWSLTTDEIRSLFIIVIPSCCLRRLHDHYKIIELGHYQSVL